MKFKSNINEFIEEMLKVFDREDLDMGEVCRDWREASMDREMEERRMSPEERREEIMNAYSIDPAFPLMELFFPPVNDLRDDTTGTEPSSNPFKEGLKFTVNSFEQGTNMHKIEQRDTDGVVDSGERSPDER